MAKIGHARVSTNDQDTAIQIDALKRVEDVDTKGPDHAADAVRYGCLRLRY